MRTFLLLLTVALLCWLLSGCTVIGLGIGAAVDHHVDRPRYTTSENAQNIPPGSAVRVTLTSGDTLRGKFIGLRTLSAEQQFMMQSNRQTVGIPLENIQRIYASPRRTYYWGLGAVIGLAVDAALVTVIAHNLKHEGLVTIGAY
jgi:hypothetical protein